MTGGDSELRPKEKPAELVAALYPSRARCVCEFAVGIGLVGLAFRPIIVSDFVQSLGWWSLPLSVLFGAGAVPFFRRSLEGLPRLTMGPEGITVHTLGAAGTTGGLRFLWKEVRDISESTFGKSVSLVLDVSAYAQRIGGFGGAWFNFLRPFWTGRIRLSPSELGVTQPELYEILETGLIRFVEAQLAVSDRRRELEKDACQNLHSAGVGPKNRIPS